MKKYKILMALMGLEIGGAETHVVELSKELKKQGIGSEVFREEPFTIARDSLGFKVYLMKWNKGRKDCTVEIEEI